MNNYKIERVTYEMKDINDSIINQITASCKVFSWSTRINSWGHYYFSVIHFINPDAYNDIIHTICRPFAYNVLIERW